MAFIRADLFIPIRYFSSSDDTNPQRTKLPKHQAQKCQVCCKILFIRPNRLFEKLVITVRLKSMCPEILQQSSFIFHS